MGILFAGGPAAPSIFTSPLTLAPSTIAMRGVWMSPWTTAVAWSSTRSRADGAADLAGDDRLLGVQVALDHGAGGDEDLGADADGPADPALDPDDALGLEVADDGHVARDDRERYLVGARGGRSSFPCSSRAGLVKIPISFPP